MKKAPPKPKDYPQTLEELQRFQLAVNHSIDPIIIHNKDGNVVYANKAVEKISGLTTKELQTTTLEQVFGNQPEKNYFKNLLSKLSKNKKSFVGQVSSKNKNGHHYIAEMHISPVLDSHKKVILFITIFRDVTKDQAMERMKTEFVSLASHQLRTPLTAINWYIEMLQTDESHNITKNHKKYLEEIYTGSKRMVQLINDLLNIARLETGALQISPQETDINKCIEDILQQENSDPTRKKVSVLFKTKVEQGTKVGIDRQLFPYILKILVSNALYYLPNDIKSDIQVVLEKIPRKGFVVSVKDKGIGIPKEVQSRIFEKFFQAQNARKQAAEGNGLGLYISKLILDKSGGKIWFESEAGKGSTFYFNIPPLGMKLNKGTKPLAV